MKSILPLGLGLLLFAVPATANNYCVSPSGSGNKTGTNWNNCMALSSITRGHTNYLKDGSYGAWTFNVSGTTPIVVKKAITNDPVASLISGWTNAYGAQAVFGTINLNYGYLTLDGAYGGGPTHWEGPFGIVIPDGTFNISPQSSTGADYVTLRHLEVDANQTSNNTVRAMTLFGTSPTYYGPDYLTLEYVYVHDSGCDLLSGANVNHFLAQHSKFARDRQQQPGCHGDLFEFQISTGSDFVFRWCFFEDVVGSYAFGTHDKQITGYEIYGNVFFWTNADPVFGNYLVGTLSGSGPAISNLKFYNNTLWGPFRDDDHGTADTDDDDITHVCIGTLNGSGNQVYNNMWVSHWLDAGDEYLGCYTGNGVAAGNSGYRVNNYEHTLETLAGDPFVAPRSTNFNLKAHTTAGTNLASPYNVDMFGMPRGVGGVWDRGAIQIWWVTNLTIAPTQLYITNGTPVALQATGRFPDNTTTNLTTNAVTWASSQPQIISVTSNGVASALTEVGVATITANWGTVTNNRNYEAYGSTPKPPVVTYWTKLESMSPNTHEIDFDTYPPCNYIMEFRSRTNLQTISLRTNATIATEHLTFIAYEPLFANQVYPGATYSLPDGLYTLTNNITIGAVIPGAWYQWEKGANDLGLTNGGTYITTTKTFFSAATNVILKGTPGAAVTALVHVPDYRATDFRLKITDAQGLTTTTDWKNSSIGITITNYVAAGTVFMHGALVLN